LAELFVAIVQLAQIGLRFGMRDAMGHESSMLREPLAAGRAFVGPFPGVTTLVDLTLG